MVPDWPTSEVDTWTLHVNTGSEPVPTLSEWGLVVLTLLLLSAGGSFGAGT